MATFSSSRRTGVLLAGVVPPGGAPLPQQTLGMGAWIGTPAELSDPGRRAELLRLAKIRRELRVGHLRDAARVALEVDVRSLPPDPDTARSIAVLRAVGAAGATSSVDPEAILRGSLELLGASSPPELLDALLEPESRVAPEVVERVFQQRNPVSEARLRVLLIRRAARDYQATGSPESREALRRQTQAATDAKLHDTLQRWVAAVQRAVETDNKLLLEDLIAALGHNLPLTEPANGELHAAIARCFSWPALDVKTQQKPLARLTFSAWSTLRAIAGGSGAGELVSFSAHTAALRQVFEELLAASLLRRFLASGTARESGLLSAVRGGRTAIGIGRWYGLLFASSQSPDTLSQALQEWFTHEPEIASFREHHRLRTGLGELLQVRLHALPHDEESARAGAMDVLETVARVGFGAANAQELPRRGEGLVGLLCGALA